MPNGTSPRYIVRVRNSAAAATMPLAANPRRQARAVRQHVYAEVARSLVDDERFPALGRAVASGIFEDESREIDFVFSLRVALDGVESLIAQASK